MIPLVAAVAALGAGTAILYNRLIAARNRADEALSQIDVQLTRRLDLIPSLVATVSGYAAHEKVTLERAIQARNRGLASNPEARYAHDAEAREAIQGLLVLAESYPDLKADQHFLMLQEELTSTENRIAFARQFYNDSVRIYNTRIQSLPGLILARPLGLERRDLFEARPAAAPTIQFPGR